MLGWLGYAQLCLLCWLDSALRPAIVVHELELATDYLSHVN
jgi:hypothetical protein